MPLTHCTVAGQQTVLQRVVARPQVPRQQLGDFVFQPRVLVGLEKQVVHHAGLVEPLHEAAHGVEAQ